jgi:hypothetical protein
MVGIEGPYISASKMPTLQPICAKVTAILDVTVDFPTPPFPDEIAIIFSIPGMGFPLIELICFLTGTTFILILILAFS